MAGNLGKLFFELGIQNKTASELEKTQKIFKSLDDYINKFNKDLQGSKGTLEAFVLAAEKLGKNGVFDPKANRSMVLYFTALQKIESKMRELDKLGSQMKGLKMDTSGIDSMRKSLESLKASLMSIGSGSGKTERLTAFNQILGRSLTEINSYQKEFSKGMTDAAAAAQRKQAAAAQSQQQALERARKASQDYANMQQRVASAVQQASGAMQQQSRWVSDLRNQLGMYFSIYGISDFLKRLIQVGGEYEKHKIALQTIIGDTQKANEIYNNLRGLALQSPFSFRQLLGDAKQLAAYSIPKNELFDTTRRLADMSAGLGVDMNRLILAYGQVRAATVLRGQEMRQFTEAGVPIIEKLANMYSKREGETVTQADIFQRVSKRMVSFEDVAAVIREMTDEGGEFYKMQEKLAETLSGKWTIMGDAWDVMMSKIANGGTATGVILKQMITWVTQLIYALDKVAPILLGLAGSTLIKRVSTAMAPVFGRAAAAGFGWTGFKGNNMFGVQTGLYRKMNDVRMAYQAQNAAAMAQGSISSSEYNRRQMQLANTKNGNIPIVRQLMAEKQITKAQFERLALTGQLNNRHGMIRQSLLREAETLGVINAKERERLAMGQRITKGNAFTRGLSSVGTGLWNFIGGWGGAAMIGGTALMAYAMNEASERAAISQADKEGKDEAKRIKKEIQDVLDEYPAIKVGVVLDEQKLLDGIEKMRGIIEERIPQWKFGVEAQGLEGKPREEQYGVLRNRLSSIESATMYVNNNKGDIKSLLEREIDTSVWDSLKDNLRDLANTSKEWHKEQEEGAQKTKEVASEYERAKKNLKDMVAYQSKIIRFGESTKSTGIFPDSFYDESLFENSVFKQSFNVDFQVEKEWNFINEALNRRGLTLDSDVGKDLYWALVNGFNESAEADSGEAIINGIALAVKSGNKDILRQELMRDIVTMASVNPDQVQTFLEGGKGKENAAKSLERDFAEAYEKILQMSGAYSEDIEKEFKNIVANPLYLQILVKLANEKGEEWGDFEAGVKKFLEEEVKASPEVTAIIKPRMSVDELYAEMDKLEKELRAKIDLLNQSAFISVDFKLGVNFDAAQAKQKLALLEAWLNKEYPGGLANAENAKDPTYMAYRVYAEKLRSFVNLTSDLGGYVGYTPDSGRKGRDKSAAAAAKQAERERKAQERKAKNKQHDRDVAANKATREALKKDRDNLKKLRDDVRDLKSDLSDAKSTFEDFYNTVGNKQDVIKIFKESPRIQERFGELFQTIPLENFAGDAQSLYALLSTGIDNLAKKYSINTKEGKEELKDFIDEMKEDLSDVGLNIDIKEIELKKWKDRMSELNDELEKASKYFDVIADFNEKFGDTFGYGNVTIGGHAKDVARGSFAGKDEEEYLVQKLFRYWKDNQLAPGVAYNEKGEARPVLNAAKDQNVSDEELRQRVDLLLNNMQKVRNGEIEGINSEQLEILEKLYGVMLKKAQKAVQDFTDALETSADLQQELNNVEREEKRLLDAIANSNLSDDQKESRSNSIRQTMRERRQEIYTKNLSKDKGLIRSLTMLDNLPKAYVNNLMYRIGNAINVDGKNVTDDMKEKLSAAMFDAEKRIEGLRSSTDALRILERILSLQGTLNTTTGETEYSLTPQESAALHLPAGKVSESVLQGLYAKLKGGEKPLDKFFNKIKAIADALQPVVDMFDALGMEDVSDIFGAANGVLSGAMDMANSAETMFGEEGLFGNLLGEKAGMYGAIAGAAISMVTQIAGLHDKALQKEIEASEHRTKMLEKDSEYMSKVLERVLGGTLAYKADESVLSRLRIYNQRQPTWKWGGNTYGGGWQVGWIKDDTHEQISRALESGDYAEVQLASLMARRDELERRIYKEGEKSKRDKNVIEESRAELRDLELEIKQFFETLAEEMYDANIKSWASDLSSALVDAFRNGEDAAKAFESTVSDIIAGLVSKMIDTRVIQDSMKGLENVMFGPNGVFTQDSDDGTDLTPEESVRLAQALMELRTSTENAKKIFDYVDDNLGGLLTSTAQGGSGAGIQGITEQTADLLASYVNAIRADVSVIKEIERSNSEMGIIAQSQLRELRSIASNTLRNANAAEEIRDIFQKVTNGTLKVSV